MEHEQFVDEHTDFYEIAFYEVISNEYADNEGSAILSALSFQRAFGGY